MTITIEQRLYSILRIQFDSIGLTESSGWSINKIEEFIKTPNWFQEYAWSEEHKKEFQKKVVKKRLLRKRDLPMWDLCYGWKDITLRI